MYHIVFPVYGEPFVVEKKKRLIKYMEKTIIGTSSKSVEISELDNIHKSLYHFTNVLRKNQYRIFVAYENYYASNERDLPKNPYAKIITHDVELAHSSPNELEYALINGYKKRKMNISGNIDVIITYKAFEKLEKNGIYFRNEPRVGNEENCYGTKPNIGLPYHWNENHLLPEL